MLLRFKALQKYIQKVKIIIFQPLFIVDYIIVAKL